MIFNDNFVDMRHTATYSNNLAKKKRKQTKLSEINKAVSDSLIIHDLISHYHDAGLEL